MANSLPHPWLRFAAGLHAGHTSSKYKKRKQSDVVCMQKASSGKLEDPEVGDLVNGIDPLWVLVDRIIAQQEKQGTFCCVPCFC